MNVQITCNLKGDVAAIGPVPVHGARHDAYAFEASGLKESLRIHGRRQYWRRPRLHRSRRHRIVPFKRLSGAELLDWQREFNTIFSKIRAAVEHAVNGRAMLTAPLPLPDHNSDISTVTLSFLL